MDSRRIRPSSVNGSVDAPPSKSGMIRAVAASLLARGRSVIENPSFCKDGLTALDIATLLGGTVERTDERVTAGGTDGLTTGGVRGHEVKCGESGLCLRMFVPIVALRAEEFALNVSGSLITRPATMLQALAGLGASCKTRDGFPPVQVRGPIRGGSLEIDGSEGSQFLTGLLMALPLCPGDSTVTVRNLKSKPYVAMTIEMLKGFGIAIEDEDTLGRFRVRGGQHYRSTTCTIEGDWSGAAFLLVAGALSGSVEVKGLDPASSQADRVVLEALARAGAKVQVDHGSVLVTASDLRGFDFDATDCPDLVPPLVALASRCLGRTVITGTDRLRHKESDRASALQEEFARLGITLDVFDERIEIIGGGVKGGMVDSHNDHRIAMACAVAGTAAEGDVMIAGSDCVAKSYPSFFEDLNSLMVAS